MKTIYIEKNIVNHPRTQRIIANYNHATIIECDYYGEIFNPKGQNFRIQKQNPALIIAEKRGELVLKTPEGFGIGGEQNYYFSHMLNCLYDCRYCFLQGMYQSANYVLFVNYEDFMQEISKLAANSITYSKQLDFQGGANRNERRNLLPVNEDANEVCNKPGSSSAQSMSYFFSGYDCDSLAYEPLTHFAAEFLPFFAKQPQAILELRTKSTNINALLKQQAINNCVVAFSFTPEKISETFEHKVPTVAKRVEAMRKLAVAGWKLGLRFDPLIYAADFNYQYQQLIDLIFRSVPAQQIHSVSIGAMRFPIAMYNKLEKLYPWDKLMAEPLIKRGSYITYNEDRENIMKAFVLNYLKNYLAETLIFQCNSL